MNKVVTLAIGHDPPAVLIKDHGKFIPTPDSEWKKIIHHYSYLNDEGKEKCRKKKLKDADIVCKARASPSQPNAPNKCVIRQTEGGPVRTRPGQQDYQLGAQTLLSLSKLFPDPAVGYTTVATILCGMRGSALRKAEPDFLPAMAISCPDRLIPLFSKIAHSIIPRKKWKGKHCVVQRNPVLDLGAHSADICNFSCVKVRRGKTRSVPLPFPYADTVALVLRAKESGQWSRMVPYLQNAAVILLNCKLSGDWGAKRVPSYDITAYDPQLANAITDNADYMAALLRWWWKAEDPSGWAESIIRAAEDSLGRQDGRYVSVVFDPGDLRRAIYHQVMLSFLDDVEYQGWLTPEEARPTDRR